MLRLLVARGKISDDVVDNLLTWRHLQYDWGHSSGFSVHAGAPVEERSEAIRLGRYGIRCPLVLERPTWDETSGEGILGTGDSLLILFPNAVRGIRKLSPVPNQTLIRTSGMARRRRGLVSGSGSVIRRSIFTPKGVAMSRRRIAPRIGPVTGAALLIALGLPLAALAGAEIKADADAAASSAVEQDCGRECKRALSMARAATAKYHDELVALDDGFFPDPVCVGIPGVGAMGTHYLNPSRLGDLDVDVRYPEVLLYVDQDGERRLVALEYFAPVLSSGAPWFGSESEPPPSIDNPPPVLFGHTFDGPMPGHNPSMPWHYDLHVWAWRNNPSGLFALFNPTLSCP